jgi:hypothetical protein
VTDAMPATPTEDFGVSNEAQGMLDSQARAFSDLGRTLNDAVEQAMKQASELTWRAQEHATAVIGNADRRVAEGLRQATIAERRAAAAQTRLGELETRVDQAQSKLVEIGARADEIARLVATIGIQPTQSEHLPSDSGYHEPASPDSWNEHQRVTNGPDRDPFAALASLRDVVDAAG